MVTVNVDQAIKKITGNFKQLDAAQTAKAIVSAINRTLIKGRTVARTEVKNIYNIPQKNLDGINNINARASFMIGYITASAKPIPMDAFAPKFETATASLSISKRGVQKKKEFKHQKKTVASGVSIEIIKGSRTSVPYAFMIHNAKPRVFARGQYKGGGNWGFIQRHKRVSSTGSDIPIKPLISVTVHGAVINEYAQKNIAKEIENYYPLRLVHELEFQVSKMVQ